MTSSTDTVGCLAVLTSLPHMGPARLAELQALLGEPPAVLDALRSGRLERDAVSSVPVAQRGPVVEGWTREARRLDAATLLAAAHAAGCRPVGPDDPDWPAALVREPAPPALLWVSGAPDIVGPGAPVVSIVGTRRCSALGRRVARSLGADLAAAGVVVCSGLAVGIDGAAHEGVRRVDRPRHAVGVVATGIDRPYPSRHAELWRWVASSGLLVSEAPPGTGPARWRFPARNRLIASLADVVVVVESRATGGSMITAELAGERGIPVAAVPGSVEHAAATGPNQLLFEGATPVRDAADVLGMLPGAHADGAGRSSIVEPVPHNIEGASAVLAVVDAVGSASLERIAADAGLDPRTAAVVVTRLELAGHLRRGVSGYERVRR